MLFNQLRGFLHPLLVITIVFTALRHLSLEFSRPCRLAYPTPAYKLEGPMVWGGSQIY